MNEPIAERDVTKEIDDLVASCEALKEAKVVDPHELAAALRGLSTLRARYSEDPAPFALRLDALRQARAAVDAAIMRWQLAIASAFVAADRAMHREEALREECRSLLLHAYEARGVNRWDAGDVDVLVQRFAAPELPTAGSPERVALESFLERTGRWRAVSFLHKTALARALDGGGFSDQERKELEQWCKLGSGYRVSIKQREDWAAE